MKKVGTGVATDSEKPLYESGRTAFLTPPYLHKLTYDQPAKIASYTLRPTGSCAK